MEIQYSDRVRGMRPSIIRELLKQTANQNIISFAGGNPAATSFPVQEIQRISEKILRDDPVATLQYSITDGWPGLRDAAKGYLNRTEQLLRDDEDVMITSGSQQAMDFLTKLLCNEGDVVATEDPAFLGAMGSFRGYGVELIGVPMEPDGVNIDALEAVFSGAKKPKFFYTIPNFQNPTGITTSLAKRKAVYELAKKYSVIVLEDNPYGELRIAGEAVPAIKSFDEEGIVVYAASLSKVLAPGLRVAFCVGEKELIAKMVVAKQANDVHTNVWAQRVCEEFLCGGHIEEHITQLQQIYRDKAMLMMGELDKQLGEKISYVHPEGGMFIWVTLPEGVDMLSYVKLCLDKNLAVVPGNAFFVDTDAPCDSIRINFASPTDEQIVTGVRIMREALDELA